jgi:choline transport protein
MVTACIVLLYISYSIPVILLLMKGRSNIKPGPFWLGSFGHFCNYVLLAWTLFTLVMYSFPYTKPVTAGSMNYVSVVYAVTFAIIGIYWVVRGKRTFRSREEREGVSSTIPVPILDNAKTVAT